MGVENNLNSPNIANEDSQARRGFSEGGGEGEVHGGQRPLFGAVGVEDFRPSSLKLGFNVFKESSLGTKIKDILEPQMRLDPGSEPGSVLLHLDSCPEVGDGTLCGKWILKRPPKLITAPSLS